MKKLIAILAVSAILASMFVFGSSAADVKFNAAKGTAVIDGVMDDCYQAADCAIIAIDETTGETAAADEATGKAWVCWDDTALYFYIEVADSTLSTAAHADDTVWQRDAVEVYVDFSDSKEDADINSVDAGQFTAGYPYPNGGTWGGLGLHWTDYLSECSYIPKEIDGGWACEVKIVFGDYQPAVGAEIGYTVGVCDDTDDADGREYHTFISADQGVTWSTVGAFWDRLILSSNEYVAPVAETEAAAETAAADTTAAPAATSAAQTSDIASVAMIVAIAALAGVVISKKR